MASSLIGQLRILLSLGTAQFETGSKRARKELSLTERSAHRVKAAVGVMLAGVTAGAFVAA
ncbi:MAG: hypothetical protein ACXWU4_03820, partial [Allosphingosinicella sp.]